MILKRKYIIVKCKDCEIEFSKRRDSVKVWGGRCNRCARKYIANTPEFKEKMRLNGLLIFQKYGQIPNGNRFKKGEMGGENSFTWKGGLPNCIECGKQLVNRKATMCVQCRAKNKIGANRPKTVIEKCRKNCPSGEKHWNWKGGSSGEAILIRMSSLYKQWRKAVFERDNYTCQKCGAKSCKGVSVILNADHIKPFSLYPELRFDASNGRTLCVSCHKKTDTFGIKLYNKTKIMKIA